MNGLIPHIEVPLIPADSISMLALIIFFMPIITFMILFFTGKHILASIRSWLATGVMGVMFVLSLYLHISIEGEHLSRWVWFEIGTIKFTTSMLLNSYSTTMMVIATFVSFMVHLYSVAGMASDYFWLTSHPYLQMLL